MRNGYQCDECDSVFEEGHMNKIWNYKVKSGRGGLGMDYLREDFLLCAKCFRIEQLERVVNKVLDKS